MTFRIPSAERRLFQPNNSDVNGNIFATRNIDFDEEGYIKLAHGSVGLFSQTDDSDFNSVNSIFHGSRVYFVGSNLFRIGTVDLDSSLANATTADTNAPAPGAEEDGVYFNGTEVVTSGNAIKYNTSGTWTDISGTPTSATGNPSPIAVFPNQNSVLFARGNKVARINTSWTVAVTLTLPVDYVVTSIDVNGSYAYIGTRHAENGEAMLFLWTGIGTTNDGSYGAGTYEISTVKKYGSSVACVNSLGQLLQFNGSGFTELAALPVYYTRSGWSDAANNNDNIANRGLLVDGDLIYIIINNTVEEIDRRVLPNMIGAVWCYDPKVGLYQKYSSTNNEVLQPTDFVNTADINTTTDVITVSGIVVPTTGSAVYYKDGGTPIGGLIDNVWYYVIKITDTTFKLAKTYKDAINNISVDLTSASNNNTFSFIKINDYGHGYNIGQSAILTLNPSEYNTRQLGRIIFTADVYTTSGNNQIWKLIATCPKVRNFGYIVTPKMIAENIEDEFTAITLRFKPLKFGDKITVKYRNTERDGLPALPRSQDTLDNFITWSNATTFTTPTTLLSNYYDLSGVAIGDEVEIINGAGSGFISTVASISLSGYQWTVTIADSNPFVAASDTSFVKFDNWKTAEVIDGSTFTATEKTIPVAKNGSFVQFKICMEGTDVALYDTLITNKAYKKAP